MTSTRRSTGTGRPREDQLLLVASDRISAFDHILDSEIPDKGKVLTQLSLWWFDQLADLVPNHLSPPTCRTPSPGAPCWCAAWRCCRSSASAAPT